MLYKLRRKLLSQNFLSNRNLIRNLVRSSSISLLDTVLEIGPGKGFITNELLKSARKVLAIEIDSKLILHLKHFYSHNPKLSLHQGDFLKSPLPNYPYKVFANTPFSIEGKIIRKLLEAENPPEDSYLVVVRELAIRLSGLDRENVFSLSYKPWFELKIVHFFNRHDFIPRPKVDAVLWRLKKRPEPLVPDSERRQYRNFIKTSYGQGDLVCHNLKMLLGSEQLEIIASQVGFSLKVKPSHLSFAQWLKLYNLLKHIME